MSDWNTCVAIVDGQPCARKLDRQSRAWHLVEIPLCADHTRMRWHENKFWQRKQMFEYFDAHPEAPHSDGWTYIVKVRKGRIKIGYVGRLARLVPRWQEVSDLFGRKVEVLSVIKGGETMESCLHHFFCNLRLYREPHEMFQEKPQIYQLAEANGIAPAAAKAVESWKKFQYRPSAPWAK